MLPQKRCFFAIKYKGFSKFIKEKYFLKSFQFLPLKIIFMEKSVLEAPILRWRRFFGHPYQWPGATMATMATMAISILWPLWPYGHSSHSDIDDAMQWILVSKEASWTQEYSLWGRFCPTNDFEGQKLKTLAEIFFLYTFWKSFVILGKKWRFQRQHFPFDDT